MRAFALRCAQRHLSWVLIGVFACAAGWVVFVWATLFRADVLTQEDIAAVRASYAGTTFDRARFDDVVARMRARHEAFTAPAQHVDKDIFFPADYTPQRTER